MSGVAASIIYPTYRSEPGFEWLADSLAPQLGDAGDVRLGVLRD